MKKLLMAICGLFTLTSCMNEVLTVHMDYISHENLASSYVGTPDPLLETALVGQRLIISWWIPLEHKECCNYEIRFKVRYGNREEAESTFKFEHRQGWYVYTLANEDFFQKKGIKTYYVQLFAGETLIDEWQHQLWVSLIDITTEEAPEGADFDYDEDEEDDIRK